MLKKFQIISAVSLAFTLQSCLYESNTPEKDTTNVNKVYNQSLAKEVDESWQDLDTSTSDFVYSNENTVIEVGAALAASSVADNDSNVSEPTSQSITILESWMKPDAPVLAKEDNEVIQAEIYSATTIRLGHRAEIQAYDIMAENNFLYSYDNEIWGRVTYVGQLMDWITGASDPDITRSVFHSGYRRADQLSQDPIPLYPFPSGPDHLTVPLDSRLELEPNIYASMNIKARGTLVLEPGLYVFSSLTMANDAEIKVDNGKAYVIVKGQMKLNDRATIWPTGTYEEVVFNVEGNLILGNDSRMKSEIYCHDDMVLKDRAYVEGNIKANYLELFNDTRIKSSEYVD